MFFLSNGAASRWTLIGLLGLAALNYTALAADTAPSKPVQIQVQLVPLVDGLLQATPRFTGQIVPIPSAVRVASCAFEGRVTRLFVQPGSTVSKNAPLLTVHTSTQTRQQVAQAKANLAFARKHLAQIKVMLTSQLTTQSDWAQAEQGLALAEANWRSLVASGATQPEHTLTAARAGVVQTISAQLGGVFTANQALLTTVAAGQWEIKIPAPVAVAQQLSNGDAVKVQPVFGAQPPLTTHIFAIDPMVLPGSNRQPIHLNLPESGSSARKATWVLGQAISAQFTLPGQTGLILPQAAVQTDASGQNFIWLDRAHKAVAVPVRVLDTVEAQSVIEPITSGTLTAGDQVVSTGAPNVAAGMTLIAAPSTGAQP
jgi:RND family efflux transporter MFP subunit